MTLPRVLFVSKPIVPPYRDGTKCLVRDVATRVERVEPVVMASASASKLKRAGGGAVSVLAAYRGDGAYAPRLMDNLRAAVALGLRSRADLWHFVYAPNPRTSRVGRALSRLRRVPVVQTVASPPRRFEGVRTLIFGDVVVTQSAWTRDELQRAAARERVVLPRSVVIPPPVAELAPRGPDARAAAREALTIAPEAPVFVYPGDLEVSAGARIVARSVAGLVAAVPDAVVVFAYRPKSPAAHDARRALERELPGRSVRFTHDLPDVLALVATSRAVLFPVDDLWGKVDLPIVLLEAMSLGVPVVALKRGPLAELDGVRHVASLEPDDWVSATLELERDDGARSRLVEAQRATIQARHRAEVVAGQYEALYLSLL